MKSFIRKLTTFIRGVSALGFGGFFSCGIILDPKWFLYSAGCLLLLIISFMMPNQLCLDEFYFRCLDAGINNLNSESSKKRAQEIAKSLGYKDNNIDNIVKYYYDAKKLFEEREAKKKQEKDALRLKRITNIEKEAYKELTQYIECAGKQKRIAMLKKDIKYYRSMQRFVISENNKIVSMRSSIQEKEKDWAIHGGIASGLGGPIAGAAAALNVQAQNAEIRARNAEKLKVFDNTIGRQYDDSLASFYGDQISLLQDEINSINICLMSNSSDEEVFKRLTFEKPKYSVSDTGTVRFAVIVKSEAFKIFEDISAVVDGTIKVIMCEGDKEVATSYISAPYKGFSKSKKCETLFLFAGKPNVEYTFKFMPYHLCEIEKTRFDNVRDVYIDLSDKYEFANRIT